MNQRLFRVRALVSAPMPRVASLLLAAHQGPVSELNARLFDWAPGANLEGGPECFRYVSSHGKGTVHVDPVSISYRGGWWYRCTYSLKPVSGGTDVTMTIDDVSRVPRWAAWLANRGFTGLAEQSAKEFETRLRTAARDVGSELAFFP